MASINEDEETHALLSPRSFADASPYQKVARTQSLPQALFNLAQNVLGAGSLGIPAAFAGAGLGGGIFLTVVLAVIGCGTLLVLAYLALQLKEQSYQGLVVNVLGKRASAIAQALILLFNFGVAVLYVQIVGDAIALPVAYWVQGSAHEWVANKKFLLAMVSLVIGPLSLARSMRSLSYASTVGVSFVLYNVGFVIVDSVLYLREPLRLLDGVVEYGFRADLSFALAFPTLVFAFMTHITFVPIAAEIKAPTTRRFAIVVFTGIFVCVILYTLIGAFGYLRFGALTRSNILNNYRADYVPAVIGRFGMAVTLCVGYPLNTFVARITFRDLFNHGQDYGTVGHLLFTLVWVVASVVLGMFIPNISFVFSFLGSVTGVAFMLVFPALMLQRTYRKSTGILVLSVGTIIFGVLAGGLAIASQFL